MIDNIYIVGMKQHPDFKDAQTTVQFLLGPIKIKDGLFIGDQFAAKDIEFIVTNKVTHIINTVSKSIPNMYQRFGVQYLSVHWTQKQENIFDKKNNAVNAIFSFVEQAMQQGESCLIHSLYGKSRAFAVIVAYLMKKYSWSLSRCLQLIHSKKQGVIIRPNYMLQMQELQKRISETTKLSNSWFQIKTQQQRLLSNTYLNSKKAESSAIVAKKPPKKKLTWDQKLVHKPVNNNNAMSSTMTRFKDQYEKRQSGPIKSILKGFPNFQYEQFDQKNQNQQQQKVINNINGNIVHFTVNNFINTQKKPVQVTRNVYNTRPFSSDNKQRQKKTTNADIKPSRLFGFQTAGTNMKGIIDNKLGGKTAVQTAYGAKPIKKRQQVRPLIAQQRPQSAKIVDQKRPQVKNPSPYNIIQNKEEMMITGKKRYPSTNQKQQLFRYK